MEATASTAASAAVQLERLIASLCDRQAAADFCAVFFTGSERAMLAERLDIFRLLAEGLTQREVAARLGCSVVTVTRGAKAYRAHKAEIDRWLSTPL